MASDPKAVAALRAKALAFILERGEVSPREVGEHLKVYRASTHITALVKAGKIKARYPGGRDGNGNELVLYSGKDYVAPESAEEPVSRFLLGDIYPIPIPEGKPRLVRFQD